MTLDDIKDEIEKAENFVILAHENPDGDAIGSSLAFYNILTNMGKSAEVLMDEYPANFNYLKGADKIQKKASLEKYDVAIVVDCPDIKRVREQYIKYFETANVKIEFDHHTKNTMFADYNIVDQACPACSQILASSFNYMNFELSKEVIECLLTGIITDTGGFRNEGTSEETFEFAGWAISKGVNITKIYREAMLLITKSKFEEEKLAMDRLEFFADGKVTFTYITLKDDQKLGTQAGDHDGIVEIGRNIKGVEVSIFLYEKEDGFKVSLRSNDYVDVSEICFVFGGGGHLRAAGATLKMDLKDAKKAIVNETIKHIK